MFKQSIAKIQKQYGDFRFTNGDCHTLAYALFKVTGEGTLHACVRETWDTEEDTPYLKTYSHMVYTDKNDVCWDIYGSNADIRWHNQFNEDEIDKWGMKTITTWVECPTNEKKLTQWLFKNGCSLDFKLLDELSSLLTPSIVSYDMTSSF